MTKPMRSLCIVDQITTATDKRFELVARMADTIIDTKLMTDDCEQQALIAKGFTQKEISALWHFANALATVEIKCCANGICSSFERGVRYA